MNALNARSIERAFCEHRDRACSARPGFEMLSVSSTSSTNDVVKEHARAGCPDGFACTALEQGAGYGRQGRVWSSPVGGAYCSVFLKPDVSLRQLPSLSLVSSMAVKSALSKLGCDGLQIKWPNDVLHDGAKVCGISLEALAGGVCVGIGVNLFLPREPQSVGGKNRPAYVVDIAGLDGVDRMVGEDGLNERQASLMERVIGMELAELESYRARWEAGGFSALLDEYSSAMAWTGAYVEAADVSGRLLGAGRIESVDADGRLLLRQDDGSIFKAMSGEVHLSAPR